MIQEKLCTKCKVVKSYELFRNDKNDKKTGKTLWCKACLSHYRPVPETRKIYRERCKAKIAETTAAYYLKNKEQIKERFSKRREDANLKAQLYFEKNKEHLCKKRRENVVRRKQVDPMFNFKNLVRGRMYVAFKKKNTRKPKKTEEILGVDFLTAKAHIQRQFKTGMTWENIGTWEIDHIIPLSSAKTIEDLIVLCHYKNLQPLWKEENYLKRAKIVPTQMYLAI